MGFKSIFGQMIPNCLSSKFDNHYSATTDVALSCAPAVRAIRGPIGDSRNITFSDRDIQSLSISKRDLELYIGSFRKMSCVGRYPVEFGGSFSSVHDAEQMLTKVIAPYVHEQFQISSDKSNKILSVVSILATKGQVGYDSECTRIHLNLSDIPVPVLVHEYTHHAALKMNFPICTATILSEGLSMGIERCFVLEQYGSICSEEIVAQRMLYHYLCTSADAKPINKLLPRGSNSRMLQEYPYLYNFRHSLGDAIVGIAKQKDPDIYAKGLRNPQFILDLVKR